MKSCWICLRAGQKQQLSESFQPFKVLSLVLLALASALACCQSHAMAMSRTVCNILSLAYIPSLQNCACTRSPSCTCSQGKSSIKLSIDMVLPCRELLSCKKHSCISKPCRQSSATSRSTLTNATSLKVTVLCCSQMHCLHIIILHARPYTSTSSLWFLPNCPLLPTRPPHLSSWPYTPLLMPASCGSLHASRPALVC